jgi:predicted DNA-binding antitoxin AbrB/MazE fold protein
VHNGKLEPLEKVDLPEGEELQVTLEEEESLDFDAFDEAAGGWKGLIDAEQFIQDIYNDRRSSMRPPPKL